MVRKYVLLNDEGPVACYATREEAIAAVARANRRTRKCWVFVSDTTKDEPERTPTS